MKKPSKKAPYKKPSKRNPLHDVQSDAGRRAKHRVAEKTSDNELRAALAYPKDGTGKPIAGHLVRTLAANQLRASPTRSHALDFDFAAAAFLGKLTYQRWGYATTIASLWKTFLELIGETDPESVRQVAETRERDFRFCAVGHVHRLKIEYDKLPYAIALVEIWQGKQGTTQVGIQHDGQRRVIPFDQPPEPPMVCHAGASLPVFIAPEDLMRMRKMGSKHFIAAYELGKIKLSPRRLELLTEDTLMNVAPPTAADLVEVYKSLSMIMRSRGYKPKRPTAK